ncbi:MAG TPA: glycosyltransferase 87 family protein [Streptosporangiaceae bacterium]
MRSVLASPPETGQGTKGSGTRLLIIGLVAFAVAFGGWLAFLALHMEDWTLNMIDLSVYRAGGLIVRQVTHQVAKDGRISYYYNAHLKPSSLYGWTRSGGKDSLQFTYTPFAAVAFALVSFMSTGTSTVVDTIVNFLALIAAIWFTLGGLRCTDRTMRIGATLLGSAVVIWTEPVFRTIYLGQINLILMAAILWDLCQPDTRKNKGFVTGIAAGVKLVPLIFIPYLIVTRKFRQAAMAIAGFVVTAAVGFAVIPKDSDKYWFGGLFYQGGRTGFTGWLGNQSLDGLVTRLAGSIDAGKPYYLLAAFLVFVAGIGASALLYRAGHLLPAILVTAETGDLISPISWDHHWVWIAPGVTVAGWYAWRAWQNGLKHQAYALAGAAVAILAVYACWPGSWYGENMYQTATSGQTFYWGWIWYAPNSNPFTTYYLHGDQPWYVEYHWHGLQLLAGNAYVFGGLLALGGLVLAATIPAWRARTRPSQAS